MISRQIEVVPDPPYPSYERLKSLFPYVRFVEWTSAPSPDEGLESAVSYALANALVSCGSVMFLHVHPHNGAINEWESVSPQTWHITKSTGIVPQFGRKWHFCFSRDPRAVQQLFHDDQYPWHLRGQLAFLFPTGAKPENLPVNEMIRAFQKGNLTNVADCVGYFRPGDDGDFAEFGVGTVGILDQFQAGLRTASLL